MNLPAQSSEEIKQRRLKILAVDFGGRICLDEERRVMNRPLKFYDDGKRTLSEMVWEKWRDADRQLLDHYNEQVSAVYDRTTLSDSQTPSESKLMKKMRSSKIGILAHNYVRQRQKNADDLSRQSLLARLYVRRLNHSMPRLQQASRIVRNIFFVTSIAASVLAVGRGKTAAIQGCVALTGLSAVAAGVLAAEKRRVNHQALRIRTQLLAWHTLGEKRKNDFYDEITSPAHMGLCGFVETFYPTR